jgi:thiol-disulfide isomerase/thioredoxin
VRKLFAGVVALALVLGVLVALAPAAARGDLAADNSATDDTVELVLFYGDGCPHCEHMIAFLDELTQRQPALTVAAYEVWNDPANQRLFADTLRPFGEEPRAVPTVVVGDTVYVGYNNTIAAAIEARVAAQVDGLVPPDPLGVVVNVPFVGDVDVGDNSLLVATLVIGFVDGVNPCSLWVLSMLLALVLHSGSRRRTLAVGGLFLVVTSALYGLYMVGAYSTLAYAGHQSSIRLGIAAVAGAMGILHLKEHFTSRGPSATIPAGAKPGMFQRMRRLADPDRSVPAVMGSTALLAVGVSLVETPCTAGLPLLWTDLLAARNVSAATAGFLFTVYLSVFLLDELLIFGAAVVTMRAAKLQEQHGRALQLVSGLLMVTLAAVILLSPGLLESVAGTVAVFAAAGLVAAVVLTGETWWSHHHPTRAL